MWDLSVGVGVSAVVGVRAVSVWVCGWWAWWVGAQRCEGDWDGGGVDLSVGPGVHTVHCKARLARRRA